MIDKNKNKKSQVRKAMKNGNNNEKYRSSEKVYKHTERTKEITS